MLLHGRLGDHPLLRHGPCELLLDRPLLPDGLGDHLLLHHGQRGHLLSRRLQRDSVAECGEVGAGDLQLEWTSAETGQRGDVQTQAGVYQSGDRWLIVNRPAAEDAFERVEDAAGLFGSMPFQQFEAQRDDTALQGEIWRLILFLMLLALLVEAWLIRPASVPEAVPPKPQPAAA